MKIKHTHPVFRTEEERLERLRELKRRCLAAISALRGQEETTR